MKYGEVKELCWAAKGHGKEYPYFNNLIQATFTAYVLISYNLKYSNFMIISHRILTKILLPTWKHSLHSGAANIWTNFGNFPTRKSEPAEALSQAGARPAPVAAARDAAPLFPGVGIYEYKIEIGI